MQLFLSFTQKGAYPRFTPLWRKSQRYYWVPVPENTPIPTLQLHEKEHFLFFSDLHLSPEMPYSPVVKQVAILLHILNRFPKAILIWGGDIFEGALTNPAKIYQAPKGAYRALYHLFQVLKHRKNILLPGNHDRYLWYENFRVYFEEVFPYRFDLLRIQTLTETFLVGHGHQFFMNRDEVHFQDIYRLPKILFSWQQRCYALDVYSKYLFSRKKKKKINRSYHYAMPFLREIYDISALICGHSHLSAYNPHSQVYTNGMGSPKQFEFLEGNTFGRISFFHHAFNSRHLRRFFREFF